MENSGAADPSKRDQRRRHKGSRRVSPVATTWAHQRHANPAPANNAMSLVSTSSADALAGAPPPRDDQTLRAARAGPGRLTVGPAARCQPDPSSAMGPAGPAAPYQSQSRPPHRGTSDGRSAPLPAPTVQPSGPGARPT